MSVVLLATRSFTNMARSGNLVEIPNLVLLRVVYDNKYLGPLFSSFSLSREYSRGIRKPYD